MSVFSSFSLDGMVALVNGASNGLGQAFVVSPVETGSGIARFARVDNKEIPAKAESLSKSRQLVLYD